MNWHSLCLWIRPRRALAAALLCLAFAANALAAPITGVWREANSSDTPAHVLAEARDGQLRGFDTARMQAFPTRQEGSWVVLWGAQQALREERVLSINSPSLGKVTLYNEDGTRQTTSLEDFSAPVHGHGRLIFRIPASQPDSAPILLKFEPSATLSGPVTFNLQTWPDFLRSDASWLIFASACFAVMLSMAAMALCFSLMLRDMTFAYYTGYLLFYAIIQSVQTGFLFHPLELQSLTGMASIIGSAAVAMSVAFAALFMTRFAGLSKYAPLLRGPVLAFAIGMPLIVLLRGSGIEVLVSTAQILLNPLLIIGAALLLFASLVAALRGSRHAWFFLAGWTPLLVLTALGSAQVDGALAGVGWLGDAALGAGAFEAIVLSIGLADRALTIRRDRDQARALADNCALTGVLNRRAWSEAVQLVMDESRKRPLALLFLDLDHFKELNDCKGHAAGDRALVAVAGALRTELRPSDLLGRYGGEEFVAMLDGIDTDNAMQVAVRLCRRVHRLEIAIDHAGSLLTVSIGVAIFAPGDDVASLVDRADAAMYTAKLSGRNRVVTENHSQPPVHCAVGTTLTLPGKK